MASLSRFNRNNINLFIGQEIGVIVKKISQSIITKRVLWTVFFLFIYCLGNRLVLPFVDLKNANIFGGAWVPWLSLVHDGWKPQVYVSFLSRLVTLDVSNDSLANVFLSLKKWA